MVSFCFLFAKRYLTRYASGPSLDNTLSTIAGFSLEISSRSLRASSSTRLFIVYRLFEDFLVLEDNRAGRSLESSKGV